MEQTFYPCMVEDRNDPLKLGRVRVRVFGVHSESLIDVPTHTLPWAIPLMPATSASLSGIGNSGTSYIEGTMGIVFFMDGESKQQPIFMGSFHGVPQNKEALGPNATLETEILNIGAPNESAVDAPQQAEEANKNIQNPESTASTLDISRAVEKYGSNVTAVYNALLYFGINDDNAVIAILSNVAKECEFKPRRENMNYTTVSGIRSTFKTKTRNLTDDELTKKYVSKPEALANLVYSDSDGNGDEASGDGWKYRGGGFIQLTKKNNYKVVGDKIGVNLISNPDLVYTDPAIAAKTVAQYFVSRYGSAAKLSFSTLNEAIQDVTKKVNPYGKASDLDKVRTAAALFTSNRTEEQKKVIEDKKEAISPTSTDNLASNASTSTDKIGFKDPSGKYPLTSMLKEQDTSRLSRGAINGTIVEAKLKNRRTDMKSIGSSFSEPLPAYSGKYPFNHVYSTESGHALEFDDSLNAERIHLYHKSGTFTEIDSYGNSVNKIIGDSYSITERNGYVYIDGTARVTVNSDVKLTIAGNMDVSVDGNVTYDIGGHLIFKVGGGLNAKAGTGVSLRTDGNIDMDGTKVMMNCNTSKQTDVSARGGSSTDYAARVPPSFVGEASMVIEEEDEKVDAYIKKEIASGNITQKELDAGAKATPEQTDETAAPVSTPVSTDCNFGLNITDTLRLSASYTLGMLSTKAAASSYKVIPQRGLSVQEIACNLKKVANNSLEKIKAQYPKMIVTSGFRQGAGKSQHELGQAIDMQFGVPNSDYYDIAVWIKDNVPFDQLLLEYKTIESGRAWIHVSYTDSPRRSVFTYMNHKNVGSGLRKLQ